MACLSCGKWHLPLEGCHQGDTPDGLALKARLARARTALAGTAPMVENDILAPVVAFLDRSEKTSEVASRVKRGKGGRPPGPNPWKDRRAAHLRTYKREYMRAWRARRRVKPAAAG